VLNGIGTMYQGDWDVIVLEGWGAWGANHWGMWPFPVPWPKRAPVETWRLVADPEFEYSKGVQPDWQEYLRLQLSLIGAGFVANIDHSPTIAQKIDTLEESHVLQVHRQMMDWADPPRLPPLTESYTQVDPGPLPEAEWGYNTINLARDAIYLHLLANPLGKTGLPHADRMAVGPVKRKVRQVVWMNRNVDLPFAQEGDRLTVELKGVGADPIDTILKLRLDGPHPAAAPTRPTPPAPVPPGNLASHKPARLLGFDGTHPVPASAFAFAQYGVDGQRRTFAQGANEWAWTYEIDLQQVRPLRRLVIHFGPGYATEYKVYLSADGANWQTMAEVTGCEGGTREHTFPPTPACYLRVQSLKPDGPGQVGSQMSLAELEAYE
jgi:hypothetical protein